MKKSIIQFIIFFYSLFTSTLLFGGLEDNDSIIKVFNEQTEKELHEAIQKQ